MASNFKFKLLSQLSKKREEGGFTLIELLVVVIIIGVLAAVALPNLLGQVGKARETELKNAVGTTNRSQQAYHFEKQAFADSESALGIVIPKEYISALTITGGGSSDQAEVQADNSNADNDGTRAYSGAIEYDAGEYSQIICQSDSVASQLNVPTDGSTCNGGSSIR